MNIRRPPANHLSEILRLCDAASKFNTEVPGALSFNAVLSKIRAEALSALNSITHDEVIARSKRSTNCAHFSV
jgi:hypothetical protein